jgi:hypothetical protein
MRVGLLLLYRRMLGQGVDQPAGISGPGRRRRGVRLPGWAPTHPIGYHVRAKGALGTETYDAVVWVAKGEERDRIWARWKAEEGRRTCAPYANPRRPGPPISVDHGSVASGIWQ